MSCDFAAEPDHLACLELIAAIDYQLDHFEQAEKWFAQALELQPDSAELYYNYVLALVGQKKYAKAVDGIVSIATHIPPAKARRLG